MVVISEVKVLSILKIVDIADEINGKERPNPTPAAHIIEPIKITSNNNFKNLLFILRIPENVNDELWDFTPFTYYFNLTGNPAATVPVGFDKNMLPIGLQIVGDMGKEFEVLQISKLFEDLLKWNELKAKISV